MSEQPEKNANGTDQLLEKGKEILGNVVEESKEAIDLIVKDSKELFEKAKDFFDGDDDKKVEEVEPEKEESK